MNKKESSDIKPKISHLNSIVENTNTKICYLETAVNLGREILKENCANFNLDSINRKINDQKQAFHTREVKEFQAPAFWGILYNLLQPAEELHSLKDSVSFKNVVQLKTIDELKNLSKGENKKLQEKDFTTFIRKAIREFKKKWHNVFDNDSGSFGDMKILTSTLEDEKKLDKEIDLLKTYFNEKIDPLIKDYAQECLDYPNALKRLQDFTQVLQIDQSVDSSNGIMSMLLKFENDFENYANNDKVTLKTLHQSYEIVSLLSTSEEVSNAKKVSNCKEVLPCAMNELSKSNELLSFIEKIVHEDVFFLVDVVQEHSDLFVSESLVFEFVDVHRFLAPLIKKKNEENCDPLQFFKMFKDSCLLHKDIVPKIKHCSLSINSLSKLYNTIGKRDELTKTIIKHYRTKGQFLIEEKDGECKTTMSYKSQEGGEVQNYSLSDLHDLRSRAYLIVNYHKNSVPISSGESDKTDEDTDCEIFIEKINLLTEIFTLLSKLSSRGYHKYQNFSKSMRKVEDLEDLRNIMQEDLKCWDEELENARQNFYFLNYYTSAQICTIFGFMTNDPKDNYEEVLSLIHFVDASITEPEVQKYAGKTCSEYRIKLLLTTVGEALDNIFRESQFAIRSIPDYEEESQLYTKLEATVVPREIFVVNLELKSPLTAKVILSLYENSSKAFPEPHQILFCSSQTTWEEIHLLLQRCFQKSENHHKSLFCIANVELLTNELQFELIRAIKDKQKRDQSCEAYKLAVICRGGNYNHIVQQFFQYSHKISGLSDRALSHRIKSTWPEVTLITSKFPGLGKTEYIKNEARKKGKSIITFPISGLFEPTKIVKRLRELRVKPYHCLHLDIGEVNDTMSLDTFLFQFIVTGMASAGGQFYLLPTTHIYIEIANTSEDRLLEGLAFLKGFKRTFLERLNYKDFIVSGEATSNVQIVCQYLDDLARDCMESKEVHFHGSNKAVPLAEDRCQELLEMCFSLDDDITFTVLNIFLGFLARQLLKFSESTFFRIDNLRYMVEETKDIRRDLLEALIKVSKEFASRAISFSRSSDTPSLSKQKCKKMTSTAENMIERVKKMKKWKDSNHLFLIFHGRNSQAVTAVYRNKDKVPSGIVKLLKSQGLGKNGELEDLNTFSQEQLQNKLEKIVGTEMVKKNNLSPSYALTQDNILKMTLILQRVRAHIPVIIMGETGCGKTSLVRFLADTYGVEFIPFNFHAGISEEQIITFINEKEKDVTEINQQIWIFLDEINTCDHLGLISEIMCHHSLLGRPLSKNLVFIAACNPYQKRSVEQMKIAGLERKSVTDEYYGLVYRVHPLPEAMIDYVWDFGSLSAQDERAYMQRMVGSLPKKHEKMLVDLLSCSQEFLRQNNFIVSLREVDRFVRLVKWFDETEKLRQKVTPVSYDVRVKEIKSIVLALAHCYLSRLNTEELRNRYQEEMMKHFICHAYSMTEISTFANIVNVEGNDYLTRMELPDGIAKNTALRENVFSMLVCILNRIPIFVVGKPGCSKSLSIQLIRSNLRGCDSQDPLFRELPQLDFVSYQGSESSTSEGIIKVFEKAQKYKSPGILPVVLLDEVGLAEISKHNPLKVLHSLLEPGKGELPDVAVVGISNWSLDAAKMNRAIYLSRPDPTGTDLYDIGDSLYNEKDTGYSENENPVLRCLIDAYVEHLKQLPPKYANFHGLRDYYSLIKSLKCTNFQHVNKFVNKSLQRNFGGLPCDVKNFRDIVFRKSKNLNISCNQDIVPVTELIEANLEDRQARHLMLITSGDSSISILKETLGSLKKEIITIIGSRFEEDLSEEYNYRILSRIIFCMERDCILILKDLENIYGSLYDMLNQNYAVVNKRKHCRVALGPYSNSMCQVNDDFRCIVLVDENKVDFSDPPFLNRFEKQLLRLSDELTNEQKTVMRDLDDWVQEISTVQSLESQFGTTDMFVGFNEDTLPSLVFSHCHDTHCSREDVLKKCKEDLMWIASTDGVLRAENCNLSKNDSLEVQELSNEYFKKPLHQGFAAFVEHIITNHQKSTFFGSDEIGSKTVVMTFSSIHTDISQCLPNGLECQVERLSAYKSEKLLAERIREFWLNPEKKLFVLQCKPELDGPHLLLARYIIEEARKKQFSSERNEQQNKHICIVVHMQRGTVPESVSWYFSFLSGWRQVFLDVLENPVIPINELLEHSVQNLLTSLTSPICKITQKDLLWCFTCIKYACKHANQRPLVAVLRMVKKIFYSESISEEITTCIKKDVKIPAHENWQVKVASNRQALMNSSTLYCAIKQFFSQLVRNSLAKIIYLFEKENVWPSHLGEESNERISPKLEALWCSLISSNVCLEITEIPEQLGVESYIIENTTLNLSLSFSQLVIRKVNCVRKQFLDDCKRLKEIQDNLDETGQLKQTVQQKQLERFAEIISNQVPEIRYYEFDCYDLYMRDFFNITTADFSETLPCTDRVAILQAKFVSEVHQHLPAKSMLEFCTLLHTFVWNHHKEIIALLRMIYHMPFIEIHVPSSIQNVKYTKLKVKNCTDLPQSDPRNTVVNKDAERTFKLGDICIMFEEETPVLRDPEDNTDTTKTEHFEDYFDDMLVTAYCEAMFPSEETIKINRGTEAWERNSKLLLSMAIQISQYPPALHYLRLCVDFSRIVLPSNRSWKCLLVLRTLNEIGVTLKPQYLDDERAFEEVANKLIKPLQEDINGHVKKSKALQKFLAMFYVHCIDTNIDTKDLPQIIEQVFSIEASESVMIISTVALRLLMVEEEQSPGIFIKIIADENVVYSSLCLQHMDKLFKDRFSKEMIHHDSYHAVMICDLIERLQRFEKHFKIDNISSDSEVFKLARCAMKLLSENSEVGSCGLRVLSSVAFVRGFLTMFAKFIAGNLSVLDENSPYIRIIEDVNWFLRDPNSSLQFFFLKQLLQHATLHRVQTWLNGKHALSSIAQLWCDDKGKRDKAKLTVVLNYTEYEEVKEAYRELTQQNDSPMQKISEKCKSSPRHAFALLGVLINMIYVKRGVEKLTDKEEHLVNWFADNVALFPSSFQELLLRIIGRRDFQCPQLQLSPESSSLKDVEAALLILHIACVVATSPKENVPMSQYFTNPVESAQTCVLAHAKDKMFYTRLLCYNYQLLEESVCVTCGCGSRLAFKSDQNEETYRHCNEVLKEEAKTTAPSTVHSVIDRCPEWERCTEQMSPVVYRALHLIVYSSFYSGIAIGNSQEKKLSSILKMLQGGDFKNPVGACFIIIERDLSYLMKILDCTKSFAIKAMHLVVERSADLLRGEVPQLANDCSTPEMRRQWERVFSQFAETVFHNGCKEIKEMTKQRQDNTLECRIFELDDYPENPKEQNRQMKRLFRMTKKPSFEDFRLVFLNSPKDVQERHRFLTLFFAMCDQISIIGNLHHLLQWSRLISSALTHRISREDAQFMSIADFINGKRFEFKRSEQEKQKLTELFEKFTEAWDEMSSLVQQVLKHKEETPRMLEDTKIIYCLTETDCGIYLRTAIEILVTYQNLVLDAIISLSSKHHCPALSFVENENCSSIRSTSVQTVNEKEIINFEYSDTLIQLWATTNPEYSRGQEITYNFEEIEVKLASKIALGKCYLTGTLNTFIFAKELFHSCGPLLTEIRTSTKQNPTLPREVRQCLSNLKDTKQVKDLLQHTEVLMYLLKRELKNVNVDKTLKELEERWSTILPSGFQVDLLPGDLIKIEHVCALYEALEDMLADNAIKGLADKYRKQLPGDVPKDLFLKEVNPHNLLTALRRFVLRYLSSGVERNWSDENKTLMSSLNEPSLWHPSQPPNMDGIPKNITLQHIHFILKYLEETTSSKVQ